MMKFLRKKKREIILMEPDEVKDYEHPDITRALHSGGRYWDELEIPIEEKGGD